MPATGGDRPISGTPVFDSLPWSRDPTLRRVLATCQDGYEGTLARELGAAGRPGVASGPGWVEAGPGRAEAEHDWCFAHAVFEDALEVRADSVNRLAAAVAGWFLEAVRNERLDAPWPLVVARAGGEDGLGRRAEAVEGAIRGILRRKVSRLARLATAAPPRTGRARGLFVIFVDFDRAFVARESWRGGQRRMADDPQAPSRSYLKVEEAYGVLGAEPRPGEGVVDLGAAPGGWSYSAARRGARVVAVDNGPLKGGALGHPGIEHRREDAFRFRPAPGASSDWLFCDLVDEPHHVLRAIVEPWVRGALCRRFVVNLKFGRADALELLGAARRALAPGCPRLAARHLFHDREEFTLVGTVGDP